MLDDEPDMPACDQCGAEMEWDDCPDCCGEGAFWEDGDAETPWARWETCGQCGGAGHFLVCSRLCGLGTLSEVTERQRPS